VYKKPAKAILNTSFFYQSSVPMNLLSLAYRTSSMICTYKYVMLDLKSCNGYSFSLRASFS